MPLARCTRPGAQPAASAWLTACPVLQIRCCAVAGSIQKFGGWSAMSVSTVTNGTPGRASARLSCRARLKLGISETTMSGAVSRQWRASRCTMAGWAKRMAACSSFSSCFRPRVKPLARRLLYRSSGCRPVARSKRRCGSSTSVRLTRRTCQGRPCACITSAKAWAAARWPPPALNHTRSMTGWCGGGMRLIPDPASASAPGPCG